MTRLSYAQALMMAGGGFPRQPETARDDAAAVQAGTPRGGTPEHLASRLMQAGQPSSAQQSAMAGAQGQGITDGGRRGQSDPSIEQPPPGAPSDARRQGDPVAEARAAFLQEMGPEAGEAAFRLWLQHQQG